LIGCYTRFGDNRAHGFIEGISLLSIGKGNIHGPLLILNSELQSYVEQLESSFEQLSYMLQLEIDHCISTSINTRMNRLKVYTFVRQVKNSLNLYHGDDLLNTKLSTLKLRLFIE
jgi:hypothetical protein